MSGAICGAGKDDFYYAKRKICKRYLLICSQDWYEPYIVIEQKKDESIPAFKKRAEKRLRFKPLSKTEFWRRRMKSIKEQLKWNEKNKTEK